MFNEVDNRNKSCVFSNWRVLSMIALQDWSSRDWSSRDVASDMIRRDVM